jgi:hypothetical protein
VVEDENARCSGAVRMKSVYASSAGQPELALTHPLEAVQSLGSSFP